MSKKTKSNVNYSKGNGRKDSWQDRESRDMRRDKFKDDEKRRGANDISWYVPDRQMLMDAASLPWANQIGQPVTRAGFTRDIRDAIPGAAMMQVYPVLGNVDSPTDPVNVAAQAIFTDVRKQNSGAYKIYGPTDLMIYIMCLDSIYYWTAYCKRAYNTVNMFSMDNKYLPEMLLKMQGIDAASIRADMPGFRNRLNAALMKIQTLVIPKGLPIFERHSFLFTDYYTEGNSIKDQMYFYQPGCYYVFDYDANGAGMLKCKWVGTTPMKTGSDLLDILDEMIDAIYMEEDFGIMAGDIRHAYGDNGVHTLTFLPDGIIARPVYNYTVLNQFKNAKCYGVSTTELDITQVIDTTAPVSPYIHQKPNNSAWALGYRAYPTEYFYSSPLEISAGMLSDTEFVKLFKAYMNLVDAPTFIVSSNPQVTPDETMVSTRLTMIPEFEFSVDSNNNPVLTLVDMKYGTEIPIIVCYGGYHYTPNQDVPVFRTVSMQEYNLNNVNNGVSDPNDVNYTYASTWGIAALMSSFKFHPTHYFFTWANLNGVTNAVDWHTLPMLDIDNYTTVDPDIMEKLHNIATLGEYNIPKVSVV